MYYVYVMFLFYLQKLCDVNTHFNFANLVKEKVKQF